jgi:hypothetical protein
MKRSHIIALGLVMLGIAAAFLALPRSKPLDRLTVIEHRLVGLRSGAANRSLVARLSFSLVGALHGYPIDEGRLQKLFEDEMQKQLAAGNLVLLRIPTANLSDGYFQALSAAARTNFSDGHWSFTTASGSTELLIKSPPAQTNGWLRLVAALQTKP